GGFRGRNTWNILVYMNADNDLYANSLADMNEMESVPLDTGVRILVLWDGNGANDTRVLEIKYDSTYAWGLGGIVSRYLSAPIEGQEITPTSGEVNMLDYQTLADFLDYASLNHPASHTALVIWSHSDGWRSGATTKGIQADYNLGPEPAIFEMTNQELALTLSGKGVSVVNFDSCLQGSLETIWALKTQSDVSYVLASSWEIYASGSDYYRLLTYFNESYRRPMDFVTAAVDAYRDQYSSFSEVSLSGYDLNALDTGLMQSFITYANANKALEKPIFDAAESFRQKSDNSILFRNFSDYATQSNYPQKSALLDMLERFIVYSWRDGSGYGFKGLAVKHEIPGPDYLTIPLSEDTDWEGFIAP
ncbi:MAG: hypothetical protein CVV50_03995, partial [Spirochaetae bacterium HGW-Spirochaetae-6]